MIKMTVALFSMVLSGAAMAQSGPACSNMENTVHQDLYNISSGQNAVLNTTSDLHRSSQTLRQIASQLQVPPINAQDVPANIDTIANDVLRSRQGMYNVRVLLNEILNAPDASNNVKLIANNALQNNLIPSQNFGDQAQNQLTNLKSQTTQISQQINQQLQMIAGLSRQVGDQSLQVEDSGVRIDRVAQRTVSDLQTEQNKVSDLVRACSHP